MYAESAAHASPEAASVLYDKQELQKQYVAHLRPEDVEYFTAWDRLIDLEADAGRSLIAQSWLSPAAKVERETGGSMSALVFDLSRSDPDGGFDTSSYSLLAFTRNAEAHTGIPLTQLGFESGYNVVVSADRIITEARKPGKPYAEMHVVRGYLHSVTDNTAIIRASSDDFNRLIRRTKGSARSTLFRIDRDNAAAGLGTLRQNLINLFTKDRMRLEDGKSSCWPTRLPILRDLIVSLRKPQFDDFHYGDSRMFTHSASGPASPMVLPGCDLKQLEREFALLNPDQKDAVRKVRKVCLCAVRTRRRCRFTNESLPDC